MWMKRFYTFFLIVIVLNSWLKIADAQVVKMPDANLAAAVRNELNLRPGTTITKQFLRNLRRLEASDSNIRDLTGLEHATQLDGLFLWENEISDITALASLTQLRWLGLGGNQITNITPIENLTQLRDLSLDGNEISDITALASLTQLRWLGLNNNQITNITPLTGLTRLEGLFLWENEISDITPLVGLTRLSRLALGDNQIDDISLVARFTRLEQLYIDRNNISDITPLANLTRLQILRAWQNGISDISPLRKLVRLRVLDLSGNFITDITQLGGLRVLEELFLADNSIQDVSPLAKLTRLKELRLRENPIKNDAPLRTLLDRNPHLKLDINIAELSTVAKPTVRGNVKMPDANLASAVRKALGLGANARITKQAIQELTRLDANESEIKNLTGLEDATRLIELSLYHNQISDVNPLAGLTRLRHLGLDGNQISDLRPVSKLTQLELLHIGGNQINNSGLRPVNKLKQLKWLSLYGNKISNIKPLARLTNLQGLWLSYNKIRDVSPLAGLENLEVLHLQGNPIRDFSPLESLTNLREVLLREEAPVEEVETHFPTAGPKIEGPWLWMIVSTGRKSGGAAATSSKDFLAVASRGSVTEQQIAKDGATAGERVRNRVWTWGKLAPTGDDNIMETVRAIGLGKSRDINNHVAYGSIALRSPRKQKTTMYVGSDDAVKVWLNGKLVHDNPIDRAASDYQDSFPVTLKKGKNILLVAIYEARGTWSGFFGFKNNAAYSLITPRALVNSSPASPQAATPAQTGLLANYPNPFNPETWIPYQLAKASDVRILIYDNRGIVVRQLELGHQQPGFHTSRSRAAYWDGRNTLGERVASGVYFYQLQASDVSPVRKMLVLK